MTIRRFTRLVIGIAALAFIAVLLFSGQRTLAGKGDRSAPTTPTNLTVTGITSTSVSLSWGPSTDNSGKLSYKVRINGSYSQVATVSQTQTSYTAKSLSSNTAYSFSVYAVDDRGNRSGDSNVVSASTLADTTPPSTPVLEASVLGPSQVQLTWTESKDEASFSCCNYSIRMNGSTYTGHVNWLTTAPGTLSVVMRHLAPGSTNTFVIDVSDSKGSNVAQSNSVSATTPPSNDTIPPTVPTNLHLVRDDSCTELWLGWTESNDNTDSQDAIEYEIYVNGVQSPLPITRGLDFDFVYATAQGDNFFTVKAVDRSGNTSEASIPLKLWRC